MMTRRMEDKWKKKMNKAKMKIRTWVLLKTDMMSRENIMAIIA